MYLPKDNFQRGNFDRYVKKPRFVGQVIDYTERDWAIVLDGRGNFHLKTDEIVDKKDHIDIISLSPYGDVNRWEVKDAKKLFRSDSESQSRLILFEYETVADRNGITYLGWGRGKADKLVQRLDISQWLIVPISFVKLMLNRVDWTKVYLKPDPRSSRDVKTEICYTRDFDPRRGRFFGWRNSEVER